MKQRCYVKTPIGTLCITEEDGAITGLHKEEGDAPVCGSARSELLEEACRQLSEYFDGARRVFTLPLCPAGTPFRKRVWEELQKIPYGETRSYAELARAVGNPRAYRAVGGANHDNPIMIFIPCHRVIGSSGALTGFAAGLSVKEKLLSLEKKGTD